MLKCKKNLTIDQEKRLRIKTISQQMINVAVLGTGLSTWEAEVLVQTIEEVYFSDALLKQAKAGQINYQCVAVTEGSGKPLEKCQMVTVVLTLFDPQDKGGFSSMNTKGATAELRQRRLTRLTEEAKEQGGYLSQEDLSELLMSDVRTIRRDIKALKALGIITPTRGQQQDIGPGISHRAIAIRLWLEGKEPIEVAQYIKHSIEAVENYLQKFKRVSYLREKGFDKYEIAMTAGISVYATTTYLEIYSEFQGHSLFEQRLDEINIIGAQYYRAQDEKKISALPNSCTEDGRRNS